MKQLSSPIIILFLLLLGQRPAEAIIYRHDINPADVLQADDAYPAVFDVFPGNGAATLIAPEWAITAAHVARDIPQDEPFFVTIQNTQYEVAEAIPHPEWANNRIDFDIALLRFAEPIEAIAPIPLYGLNDEGGAVATIVGRGDSGTGLTGAVARDQQLRAVTNQVAFFEDDRRIVFVFDPPEHDPENMFTAEPTPLEGIGGPGDSGGPALIAVNGADRVAGISIFGAELGDQAPGTYETIDIYTRVYTHLAWIAETAGVTPPERVEGVSAETPTVDNTPEVVVEVAADETPFNWRRMLLPVIVVALIAVGAVWWWR